MKALNNMLRSLHSHPPVPPTWSKSSQDVTCARITSIRSHPPGFIYYLIHFHNIDSWLFTLVLLGEKQTKQIVLNSALIFYTFNFITRTKLFFYLLSHWQIKQYLVDNSPISALCKKSIHFSWKLYSTLWFATHFQIHMTVT